MIILYNKAINRLNKYLLSNNAESIECNYFSLAKAQSRKDILFYHSLPAPMGRIHEPVISNAERNLK